MLAKDGEDNTTLTMESFNKGRQYGDFTLAIPAVRGHILQARALSSVECIEERIPSLPHRAHPETQLQKREAGAAGMGMGKGGADTRACACSCWLLQVRTLACSHHDVHDFLL
jgi:hypothetical protein